MVCEGVVHKDCGFAFCMSRQGIININKGSSIFSFRKRSKFAKMAEHFEYNHIPAQMSSINHFRVKSVLCFRESLVILHLTRNTNSQFGLLDLRLNKFIGVFGRQRVEFVNEVLAGEISPDKSKCLVRLPNVPTAQGRARGAQSTDMFQLYDLKTKQLIRELSVGFNNCHFCFDPRFKWRRAAITNFEQGHTNSLSIVHLDKWDVVRSNPRVDDTRRVLHPFMKELCYTRDGSLLVATILDTSCYCREKKTRNYRPICCSIYVFNADTTETVHCVQYNRYACTQHNCPINYTPLFSTCGSRMAVVMNRRELPPIHHVQVYKLPTPVNLQSLCRINILQHFSADILPDLPLPPKLIHYIHFKPEFE